MKTPLGKVRDCPISNLLGTGFRRFESRSGLCGLVRMDGNGIELLAIDAHPPGKGQFRHFIKRCKKQYDSILILAIWNPWLGDVLARYGFVEWSGERMNEPLTGMLWRRAMT